MDIFHSRGWNRSCFAGQVRTLFCILFVPAISNGQWLLWLAKLSFPTLRWESLLDILDSPHPFLVASPENTARRSNVSPSTFCAEVESEWIRDDPSRQSRFKLVEACGWICHRLMAKPFNLSLNWENSQPWNLKSQKSSITRKRFSHETRAARLTWVLPLNCSTDFSCWPSWFLHQSQLTGVFELGMKNTSPSQMDSAQGIALSGGSHSIVPSLKLEKCAHWFLMLPTRSPGSYSLIEPIEARVPISILHIR